MLKDEPDPAGREQRTLIRNARQLLTLHGASGPRRGPAMRDLGVIQDGALLIHKGIIEEAGPTRRIENLSAAKLAKVIDASGKVVMPAFIDPDYPLVVPRSRSADTEPGASADNGAAIRITSRNSAATRAAALAAELVRYGCLSIGSHTACATDLRNVIKVLRVFKEMQARPLRIRSVFSLCDVGLSELEGKWLPSIKKQKLAAVMDVAVGGSLDHDLLQSAVALAADAGLAVRVRSDQVPDQWTVRLALNAGAIALVAPSDAYFSLTDVLATNGCVRVVPTTTLFEQPVETAKTLREQIDEGAAVAVSSGFCSSGPASVNMQFQLFLWVHAGGMSNEEAIMASTYNAACSLRMSHVTGSLEPGKSADVLIMDVPDYRELSRRAGHLDLLLAMRAGRAYRRRGMVS